MKTKSVHKHITSAFSTLLYLTRQKVIFSYSVWYFWVVILEIGTNIFEELARSFGSELLGWGCYTCMPLVQMEYPTLGSSAVTLCSWVERYKYFSGICCLQLHSLWEVAVAVFCKTLILPSRQNGISLLDTVTQRFPTFLTRGALFRINFYGGAPCLPYVLQVNGV